ncbi:MAG: Holliday junction branch migration protein RuvA [Steroidobacteraceae bacterium]
MIGTLSGILMAKEPPHLLLEVGGVGYEVEAPMSTWLGLPAAGQPLRLMIHHVLREDASLLYGFATADERSLFRALLKVSGVGPKVALAVLSGVSVQAFQSAIVTEDAQVLTRIPGVGRKTAQRLLVEMRDHFKDAPVIGGIAGEPASGPEAEALYALVALGYKPAEARTLLDGVDAAAASTEELIRAALQRAAGGLA